jgi:hypothetical protein
MPHVIFHPLSFQFHVICVCHLVCYVMLMLFTLLVYRNSQWRRLLTYQCVICLKWSIMFGSNVTSNVICKISSKVHYTMHI